MKTLKITMLGLLLVSSSVILAQPPGGRLEERKEEIDAMKIGFLTKRLNLTSEEAKVFWPVYNQYQDELENLRKSRRGERKEAKDDFSNMTDKDVEKVVDGEIVFRQQEIDIMKKYHAQFKQVLPIKKVATLYRTEEDFKRELLKRIQERKDEMRERPRMR